MNAEHGGQIYIAKAPALFAGLQCYPGSAVRSDSSPGDNWEAYDPARHGPAKLILEFTATVAQSCRTVAL